MKQELRDRAFLPVVLPVGAVVGIIVFAFALSRVLLAVPELVSTFTALLLAGYVLLVAALAAARPRITGRALGVGMFVGLIAVVSAGAVSAGAGMRELHHDEGDEGSPVASADRPEGVAEVPEGAVVFTAVPTIAFAEEAVTAPAGEATMALVNEDTLFHDVAVDELGGVLLEANPTEVVVDDFTLEAGEYVFYCTVPGHREAGMEGSLTVQ